MMKFIRGKSASNPSTPSKRNPDKGCTLSSNSARSQRNSVDLQNKPCALAYDPRRNLLAIGSRSGSIKIYGKQGLELQSPPVDGGERISQMLFVESTGKLVCLCEDSSIHLWEIVQQPAELGSPEEGEPARETLPNGEQKPDRPAQPTACRRLLRTKSCRFFSRQPRLPLVRQPSRSPTGSIEQSESGDSGISAVSSQCSGSSEAIETADSRTQTPEQPRKTPAESSVSLPAAELVRTADSAASLAIAKQNGQDVQGRSACTASADDRPTAAVDQPDGRLKSAESLADLQPTLPASLQERLCSWSNEIVSFTLSVSGAYVLIVTRMGEMFMLDVHRFELISQRSLPEQIQAPLPLPPPAGRQTPCSRFGSELNLNSSCSDSVISCGSTLSTLSGSTSSDEASLPEMLEPACVDRGERTTRPSKQFMVKVYTSILCAEVEYKTLSITNETTSKQLICLLLSKFKLKHRDPNLFYLTMEIRIRKAGVAMKNVMVLNDESCPVQLKSCYPHEETKFCLMMKSGGLVKVYDSCLMSGSLYKSVLLSESTTAKELVQLILHCYGCKQPSSDFELFQVSKSCSTRLHEQELPLQVQSRWNDQTDCFFQLRRTGETKAAQLPIQKYTLNRSLPDSLPPPTAQREYENYFYI